MFKKITKIVAAMLIVAFATATVSPVTAQASSDKEIEDFFKRHSDATWVDADTPATYGPITLEMRSYDCFDFKTLDEMRILTTISTEDEHVLQHTDMKLYRNGKLVYKGKMYGDESTVSRETERSSGATGAIDVHKHKKIKQGIYTIKYRYNYKGTKTKWESQTVPTSVWRGNKGKRELSNGDMAFSWVKHPNAYKYDIYLVKQSDYEKNHKLVKVTSTKKSTVNLSKYGFKEGDGFVFLIDPVCKYKGKNLHVNLQFAWLI